MLRIPINYLSILLIANRDLPTLSYYFTMLEKTLSNCSLFCGCINTPRKSDRYSLLVYPSAIKKAAVLNLLEVSGKISHKATKISYQVGKNYVCHYYHF